MPYIGRDLNRGNYLKLDDISSSFNSSTKTFNLRVGGSAFTPGSAFSILVSVGGVIQEPESAYQVNNSEITFANAPTAQDSFFCLALGVPIGIGVPGNSTVNGTQMAKPFNYDGFFHLNDSSNRVGINSSIPTASLDVIGNIKLNGNLVTGSGSGGLQGNVYAASGISTFNDVRITNNLTVEGTTTTLDTNLVGVDRIEVAANSNTVVGVAITQSGTADILNLYDGSSEVFSVTDGGITKLKKGLQIIPATNNLYATDGTLSYYGTTNGVYLNGAGASGWLRLNASGASNDRTAINLFGQNMGGFGDQIRIKTASGERIKIGSDGKVGINTTDTGYLITVLAQSASSTIARFKAVNKNSNFDIHTDASSHGQVYVRNNIGAAKVALNSNGVSYFTGGSVGIGTDVPQNNLEVVGGITVTGEAPNQGLYFSDPSNKIEYFSIYKHASDNSLRVHGYDSSWGDKITILRNGNVGINSTIPSQKVDVIGTVKATNFVGALPISNAGNDYVLTSAGGSGVINAEANLTMTGNILTFNTTANTHRIQNVATGNHYTVLEFDSNRSSAGDSLAFIDFQWDGTKVADIQVIAGSDTTNKDDGHIAFRTSPAQGSIAERLRITSAGRVGINSTTPEFEFDVLPPNNVSNNTLCVKGRGSGYAQLRLEGEGGASENYLTSSTTPLAFYVGSGGQKAKLETNGMFLIGAGGADQYLHIKQSATTTYAKIENTGSSSNYTGINLRTPTLNFQIWNQGPGAAGAGYGGANSVNFWTAAAAPYTFHHGNTERLRIDTSGHMGLGVEPNANWPTNNDFKALQIGTGFCVFGRGTGDEDRGGIAANWYSDGSNQKYIGNGNAARIYLADGNMYFSNAANNTSGANTSMTLEDRVIIDTTGNIQIRGTNHATMYYRDDGARYGSIFYDGYNFVTRMPAGDNYQVEQIDGTVTTRFNNVNGQSGTGSLVDFYGGDNTYLYVRGGTETKPSIYMGGGAGGVDNSRIGTKYNLALACNEDGNQTGRKIVFYDDDVKLAELREDNQGTSSAQGCLYTTGPGAIRDYYDMRNIKLDGTTFDYVSNDSDGGGTSWEIKNGSVIRLYSTAGGHGGKWGREVYIRQNGYYYWRCNVRLTTTCGAIHNNTSTNHYQYPIMFRFRMHNSGAGNNCQVELNQHYATTGTCNGNQTGTGNLTDGTYVTRTGNAVYLTAGVYQPRYFTNGYLGVRELHIYELALIQCGSSTTGA